MLKIDKLQLEVIINGDPARLKLQELQQKANLLTKEMRGIKDQELLGKKKEELASLQRAMEDIRHEIGLDGMSMKELGQRSRELQSILSQLRPGTEEFKKYKAELDAVNARQKELRTSGEASGNAFSRMSAGVSKYIGIIGAATAGIMGIVFGVKKATDAFIEFEDRMANLSSLTGLTGEDLNWLGDQAKKLSVTTLENGVKITKSATDIVDAFTIMGSKKPELLQNKEALAEVTKQALILAEAAKMDTKPAVEGLAIVMNQFGADASKAGQYINVLAAGSKEGAAEIPSITDSILKFGAAAKASNINVEQSVSLVETLAEKGIQGEVAGTGLRAMLIKMQTGADDTNPKIVGLNTALENLAAKNLTAAQMTKMFGLETYTVAQTILSNVDRVNYYTKAVTGTNVAIEQATINTNTNKAALAQSANEAKLVAIAFGEKLIPVLTSGANIFTILLKSILAVVNIIIQYKTIILSAIAGIVAYTVVVKAQTIATKAYELATTIATKATQFFNTVSKASPWGLIAGLITAAAVALLTYKRNLDASALAQQTLDEVNNAARKNIVEEKLKVEELLRIGKDEKKSKEDRLKAIQELNKISPEYLGNLTLENINTIAAKDATDKYILSLEKKARVQAAQEKLVEIEKQLIDLQDKGAGAELSNWQKLSIGVKSFGNIATQASNVAETSLKNYNKTMEELIAKRKVLTNVIVNGTKEENAAAGGGNGGGGTDLKKLSDFQKQRIELYRKYVDDKRNLDSALSKSEEKELREALRSNKVELTKNLDAEEKAYANHLTKLNTDYYNARLKSNDDMQAKLKASSDPKEQIRIQKDTYAAQDKLDEQHKIEIEDAETAHLLTRIAITKQGGDETGKLEEQLAKHRIDILDRRNKDADKLLKSEIKDEEKAQQTRNQLLKKYGLEDFRSIMEEQLKLLEASLDAENLSYEDKLKIRQQIAAKFALEMAEKQRQQDEERVKNASKQVLANRLQKGDISQADYNKGTDVLDDKNDIGKKDNGKNAGFLGQLGNVKSAEQLQVELNKAAYEQGIINKTEYERKQNEITKQATDERIGIILKGLEVAQKIETSFSNFISSIQEAQSINLKTKQDKETKDLEDQHDKKLISDKVYNDKKKVLDKKHADEEKALKKKNANIEFIIQVAQILTSTAMAVAKSVAASPLSFGLPWSAFAIAEGAAQVAVANAQKNAVNQLAKGKYNVTGADDGKLYNNVPYIGTANTGLYKKPTLIAEKEEMVIDNPTLNNLRYNAPYIFDVIENNRVKQFAEGNYPQQYTNATINGNQTNDQLIQLLVANTAIMQRLNNHLDQGIKTEFNMHDFKTNKEVQWNNQQKDVTKS